MLNNHTIQSVTHIEQSIDLELKVIFSVFLIKKTRDGGVNFSTAHQLWLGLGLRYGLVLGLGIGLGLGLGLGASRIIVRVRVRVRIRLRD